MAEDIALLLRRCRANPAALSAWEVRFLADMERRRTAPTPRQRAVLERIAVRLDLAAVNRAALVRLEEVCRRLLPGGARVWRRWRCGNLQGGKGQSVSVVLSGDGAGRWADFATGQSGGDPRLAGGSDHRRAIR